jgi:hypothetical protein
MDAALSGRCKEQWSPKKPSRCIEPELGAILSVPAFVQLVLNIEWLIWMIAVVCLTEDITVSRAFGGPAYLLLRGDYAAEEGRIVIGEEAQAEASDVEDG